jgi:hypothetical protein
MAVANRLRILITGEYGGVEKRGTAGRNEEADFLSGVNV